MPITILIADDDPIQRRLLTEMVKRAGYDPIAVDGGEAAIRAVEAGEPKIDLLILDLVMPDLDGMGVLGRLRERDIALPVIVQTAHGSIETVISAMRAGAADFVVKPVGSERLQISMKNALRVDALEGELRRVSRRGTNMLTFRDLVTRSSEMERVIRLGERAARSAIPVLLEGESGVGKEVIARAIQGSGERRGKPFVTVNCGAIPGNLVESILFGHEKGSFTGASDRHIGKFVEASGGTLFLDEVGELPLDAQVKLLRAIQEGEVDPVGGRKSVKVDIRIISATNQNLIQLVKDGRFREDLYYRLNVFPVSIPPLRVRRDDIPDLARRFLARFAAEEGRNIRAISSEAMALIQNYDWPGNVRQLENALFRAVVLAEGDELTVAEFPQIAAQVDGFDVRIPRAPAQIAPVSGQQVIREVVQVAVNDPSAIKLIDDSGDMRKLDEIERETIKFAIAHYR
ncbi:MAG: sigma-54-dependent transcriptional regulator, partial [Beijerinckiaceae bacterium]